MEEEQEKPSVSAVPPPAEATVGLLEAAVEEIASISDYRNAYRKLLCNLSRRIKLLAPMVDELRDRRDPIPEAAARTLEPLAEALGSAKQLLRFGSERSRIFLVLERDAVMKRFQEVIAQLEQALNEISFDELVISDEVREQVELVQTQFKRAKEQIDGPDAELCADLLSAYHMTHGACIDPSILERLTEKLYLTTIADLKQESLALHDMVASSGEDPGEHIEKMSTLLKKIKDFVQTRNPEMGTSPNSKVLLSERVPTPSAIPDEFRCPVSLELMIDPVIVATGQTYERVCIEKWLASGHNTCPATQQRLANTTLTPNYALRSLIAQWCELNGMDAPKRPSQSTKPAPYSSSDRATIDALLPKLCSPNLDDQRSAAGELRLLAKRNTENRACIAEAGAIPLLVSLLSSADLRIQEHTVTALLNLSILEENKRSIVSLGAVPGIVHVLWIGSMEARENAAAALFSLSVVDEYKVVIGASGAIPALVSLLSEGTQRGKKDAATAIFNLCIYQGNKGKAIRAGVIPLIMGLVQNPIGSVMDEAMAILAILSGHPEGRAVIGAAEPMPMLVDMIGNGSPRNRENAAAVLLNFCGGEQQFHHLAQAQECGVMAPLRDLAMNGTERGKRKALQLLERMSRFLIQQQEQAGAVTSAMGQSQVSGVSEPSDHPSPAALV